MSCSNNPCIYQSSVEYSHLSASQSKILITIIIEKSFSFYNVVSVRGQFLVSPWLVSHAENVIRGAYDDCGHFNCYVVEVRLFNA